MSIREIVRKRLLEAKQDKKREFGCLMVGLNIDKDTWKEVQDMVDEEDLYVDPNDGGFGREMDPHITILFGLHPEVKDEEIEVDINKIPKPKLNNKGVSCFKTKEYDVLKFEIESSDLEKQNKVFKKYPFTNTFKEYRAHATIAYLKPNTVDKYLESMKSMNSIEFDPKDIIYSKVDKTEKKYDFK